MTRKHHIVAMLIIVALLATGLTAQPISNHLNVVQAVKASLATEDLSGPCGAFKITRRVAWQLRGEGAGLLHKPTGNRCEDRSVDIIVYPSGRIFDILIDGGGQNLPMWHEATAVDPGRWRAPTDPGDTTPPPPPPPPSNLKPIIEKLVTDLATLQQTVAQLQRQDAVLGTRLDTAEALIRDDVQLIAALQAQVGALDARIQALEALPRFTTCRVSIFGIRAGCRLE